jgi:hypothetical protein
MNSSARRHFRSCRVWSAARSKQVARFLLTTSPPHISPTASTTTIIPRTVNLNRGGRMAGPQRAGWKEPLIVEALRILPRRFSLDAERMMDP